MKFFREQFVPELKASGIDTIIIPGDFFDNRLALDSRILNNVYDLFDNDFKDFQIYIIVGNHDSYLESSIHINSLKVFEFYENVHVISSNKSLEIGGRTFFFCPWVTNHEEFLKELSEIPNHDICVGHFNFSNFLMHKNQEADHGLSSEMFYKKFKITISGHFHTRSSKRQGDSEILYIGNPFHLTRNDIDDSRGYCVMDLDDLSYEFFENTKSLKFVKYYYPEVLEESHIKGNHVDVFINYSESFEEKVVDAYFERLEKFCPAFPINRKTINNLEIDTPEQMKGSSVPELITEYLKNQSFEDKDEISRKVFELYEACKGIM
jgi:DNA repair exonuclease SbcCD nuclease subunit